MILHADSEDIAKYRIIVILRKARAVRGVETAEVLKDELARAVFLKCHDVDTVTRLTGWREGSEVGSVVWLAAGVCR